MSRFGSRTRVSTAVSTWTQADLLFPRVEVDYLIVGGGGSSISNINSSSYGNGAGGLRSSYSVQGGGIAQASKLILTKNTNYAVVVGAGGSNSNGSTSSIDTTLAVEGKIESLGGSGNDNSFAGGAAVGGSAFSATGGTYGYNGVNRGGGGAGEAGSTDGAHHGGDGVSNSITGSATFYAGGGGGNTDSVRGLGGDGGGGNGSTYYDNNATPGTANTGGGGGGGWAGQPKTTQNGGSGIVILRFSTQQGTITVGAGLTSSSTTSGSDTIVSITAGSGNVSWA